MAGRSQEWNSLRAVFIKFLFLLTISSVFCSQHREGDPMCVYDQRTRNNELRIDIRCFNVSHDYRSIVGNIKNGILKIALDKDAKGVLKNIQETQYQPAILNHIFAMSVDTRNLTTITSELLEGLDVVKRFGLSSGIKTMRAGAFDNMVNLVHLNLQQNSFRSIPDKMFIKLRKLRELIMFANQLTELYDLSLMGLVSLRKLVLPYNKIERISVRAFDDLADLQVLDLGVNRLEFLDPATFQMNKKLKSLFLSGNNLRKLGNFQLQIPSLANLYFDSCHIKDIPIDYFSSLPNLKTVYLSKNNLTTIRPGLFSRLPRLSLIVLNLNEFKHINLPIFKELFNLNTNRVATLAQNSWDCSKREMADVKAFCNENKIDFGKIFSC